MSEVPKFEVEDYLVEKAFQRQMRLYHGVLFMLMMYTVPCLVCMFLLCIGLFLEWSAFTIAVILCGFITSFVVFMAVYYSLYSKRYLGLVNHSSLYVTPNGVYQIEWLPVKVNCNPIEVNGKTYYLSEVINHKDSDIPYLLVVTDGKFDVSGGEMVRTQKDFKFFRGVRCPVSLAYDTLVELRCLDIGVYPIENLEEQIPVPLCYMTDSWYHHSAIFKGAGRIGVPENLMDIVEKSVKVFDDLHAREWKEKAELYEKRIRELENIDKDYLKTAMDLFKRYLSERKLFGFPQFGKRSKWEQMGIGRKIGVGVSLGVVVAVASMVLFGLLEWTVGVIIGGVALIFLLLFGVIL